MTKTWKLQLPNLLIMSDAGAIHPTTFVSDEMLRELDAFSGLVKQADHQIKALEEREMRRGHGPARPMGGSSSPGPEDDPLLSRASEGFERNERKRLIVNQLMWTKLVTIFTSVVDAAALSNNWIVVDRVNSMSQA